MRNGILSVLLIVIALVSFKLTDEVFGTLKTESKTGQIRGKDCEQITKATEVKEVPTERPKGVPEDWILFYDWEVGYSLYYPPDWHRFIPEHTNPKGLRLWKEADYHREISMDSIGEVANIGEINAFVVERAKNSVYKDRLNNREVVKVGSKDAILYKEPNGGVMDIIYFSIGKSILSVSLELGGEHGGGVPSLLPTAQEDEKVFFQILKTFQFAE